MDTAAEFGGIFVHIRVLFEGAARLLGEVHLNGF
jgi:hypothetical protein